MDLVIVGIAIVAIAVFVYAMISNKPTVKEVNEQINLDVVKEEVKPVAVATAAPKAKKPAAKKAPATKAATKKPAAKKTSKPAVKSVTKTQVTRKK